MSKGLLLWIWWQQSMQYHCSCPHVAVCNDKCVAILSPLAHFPLEKSHPSHKWACKNDLPLKTTTGPSRLHYPVMTDSTLKPLHTGRSGGTEARPSTRRYYSSSSINTALQMTALERKWLTPLLKDSRRRQEHTVRTRTPIHYSSIHLHWSSSKPISTDSHHTVGNEPATSQQHIVQWERPWKPQTQISVQYATDNIAVVTNLMYEISCCCHMYIKHFCSKCMLTRELKSNLVEKYLLRILVKGSKQCGTSHGFYEG